MGPFHLEIFYDSMKRKVEVDLQEPGGAGQRTAVGCPRVGKGSGTTEGTQDLNSLT